MLEWMFVGTLGGLGAVVLMGLEALNCLLTCRGKRRTRLLYAAAGLGIVLLLWWGGDALLKMMGLGLAELGPDRLRCGCPGPGDGGRISDGPLRRGKAGGAACGMRRRWGSPC